MGKCKECQELKNKIEFMEEYIKTVENARDELERENKFLKEENTEIRKYQYEQDFLQQQQLDKVIKENKEIKTCYKNNLALLDKEEVNTTKLVNKVMKLEKTLIEIKEIAQYDVYTSRTDLCLKLNWIKKKISECEV